MDVTTPRPGTAMVPMNKIIENAAEPGPRKVFVEVKFYQDGGATHSMDLSAIPKKGRDLAALMGNIHILLWQMLEWTTAIFRGEQMREAAEREYFAKVLSEMSDETAN